MVVNITNKQTKRIIIGWWGIYYKGYRRNCVYTDVVRHAKTENEH